MIWAALALLGIPIWLIVGALIGAMASRRRFMAQPDVVPLLYRSSDDDQWPRRLAYGRYVHDVLLVNSGLALVQTKVHVVERAERLQTDELPDALDDPVGWDGHARRRASRRRRRL